MTIVPSSVSAKRLIFAALWLVGQNLPVSADINLGVKNIGDSGYEPVSSFSVKELHVPRPIIV